MQQKTVNGKYEVVCPVDKMATVFEECKMIAEGNGCRDIPKCWGAVVPQKKLGRGK